MQKYNKKATVKIQIYIFIVYSYDMIKRWFDMYLVLNLTVMILKQSDVYKYHIGEYSNRIS